MPEGVDVVAGDLSDVGSAIAACAGASVVYLCASPPYRLWTEQWPSIMNSAIEGTVTAGAKLIFGDNLYAYGLVDGPIKEDMPYGARGPKGLTRAVLANTLMDVYHSGKLLMAIGRAPDCYGPFVTQSQLGETVFGPVVEGKPARVLGNPDLLHSYMYIEDFGRGLVTLGERDEAAGQIWHIPCAETITTRQLLDIVFDEIGHNPGIKVISGRLLSMKGYFEKMLKELREIRYMMEEPFVVDYSKYESVFGNESTPHREAVRKTVDWYRRRVSQQG